jgi:hypothetical protein
MSNYVLLCVEKREREREIERERDREERERERVKGRERKKIERLYQRSQSEPIDVCSFVFFLSLASSTIFYPRTKTLCSKTKLT